ncbi:hypothetical protein BKA70DRAFT_1214405 [Coprinopsis sp. MPI-PUGE-AT-0042]|nr:hypothetical protein BKA70DRAFT_1214405 [Coprinopsis sp. MPI-PUGE-AT-0042]
MGNYLDGLSKVADQSSQTPRQRVRTSRCRMIGRSHAGVDPDSQSPVPSPPGILALSPALVAQSPKRGSEMRRIKSLSRPRPGRLSRRPPIRSRLRLLNNAGVKGKSRQTNIYWGPQKSRKSQKKINNVAQFDVEKKSKPSSTESPPRPSFRPDRLSAQQMALDYAFVRIPIRNGTRINANEASRPTTSLLSTTQVSHNLTGHSSSILSFTPLPPLPSLRPTTTTPLVSQKSVADIYSPTVVSDSDQAVPPPLRTGTIATPFLVLIAIGATFFLLGIAIVLRVITRPRKRQRIQPSLPILDKSIEDENYDSPESPMFGGKERLTATEKNGPLWTWVQYTKRESLDVAEKGDSHNIDGASSDYFTTNSHPLATVNEGEALRVDPPRAQKRTSYASVRDNGTGDGKALPSLFSAPQPTTFTGDGHRVLQRLSRVRDLRRSQSYLDPRDACGKRDSAYRPDSAYDGADVSSPVTYYQPVSTPVMAYTPAGGTEGRARIQSAYFAAGTYPRTSSVPGTYSINTATKINLAQAQAHSLNTRSNRVRESRNDKELGLIYSDGGSPTPSYNVASPQPTLYPDESLSVIGSRRTKRNSHNAPRNRDSRRFSKLYTGEAGARGDLPPKSLLEMEFDVSRMSLSDITVQPVADLPSASDAPRIEPAGSRSRNDRPPRVPSPPPMPSLAQMAFAHANPDAYNNYHSPTYSLYGMYGDRKSTATTVAR